MLKVVGDALNRKSTAPSVPVITEVEEAHADTGSIESESDEGRPAPMKQQTAVPLAEGTDWPVIATYGDVTRENTGGGTPSDSEDSDDPSSPFTEPSMKHLVDDALRRKRTAPSVPAATEGEETNGKFNVKERGHDEGHSSPSKQQAPVPLVEDANSPKVATTSVLVTTDRKVTRENTRNSILSESEGNDGSSSQEEKSSMMLLVEGALSRKGTAPSVPVGTESEDHRSTDANESDDDDGDTALLPMTQPVPVGLAEGARWPESTIANVPVSTGSTATQENSGNTVLNESDDGHDEPSSLLTQHAEVQQTEGTLSVKKAITSGVGVSAGEATHGDNAPQDSDGDDGLSSPLALQALQQLAEETERVEDTATRVLATTDHGATHGKSGNSPLNETYDHDRSSLLLAEDADRLRDATTSVLVTTESKATHGSINNSTVKVKEEDGRPSSPSTQSAKSQRVEDAHMHSNATTSAVVAPDGEITHGKSHLNNSGDDDGPSAPLAERTLAQLGWGAERLMGATPRFTVATDGEGTHGNIGNTALNESDNDNEGPSIRLTQHARVQLAESSDRPEGNVASLSRTTGDEVTHGNSGNKAPTEMNNDDDGPSLLLAQHTRMQVVQDAHMHKNATTSAVVTPEGGVNHGNSRLNNRGDNDVPSAPLAEQTLVQLGWGAERFEGAITRQPVATEGEVTHGNIANIALNESDNDNGGPSSRLTQHARDQLAESSDDLEANVTSTQFTTAGGETQGRNVSGAPKEANRGDRPSSAVTAKQAESVDNSFNNSGDDNAPSAPLAERTLVQLGWGAERLEGPTARYPGSTDGGATHGTIDNTALNESDNDNGGSSSPLTQHARVQQVESSDDFETNITGAQFTTVGGKTHGKNISGAPNEAKRGDRTLSATTVQLAEDARRLGDATTSVLATTEGEETHGKTPGTSLYENDDDDGISSSRLAQHAREQLAENDDRLEEEATGMIAATKGKAIGGNSDHTAPTGIGGDDDGPSSRLTQYELVEGADRIGDAATGVLATRKSELTHKNIGNTTLIESDGDDNGPPSSLTHHARVQLTEDADRVGGAATGVLAATKGEATIGNSGNTALIRSDDDGDGPSSQLTQHARVQLAEDSDRIGGDATSVLATTKGEAIHGNRGNTTFIESDNDDDGPYPRPMHQVRVQVAEGTGRPGDDTMDKIVTTTGEVTRGHIGNTVRIESDDDDDGSSSRLTQHGRVKLAEDADRIGDTPTSVLATTEGETAHGNRGNATFVESGDGDGEPSSRLTQRAQIQLADDANGLRHAASKQPIVVESEATYGNNGNTTLGESEDDDDPSSRLTRTVPVQLAESSEGLDGTTTSSLFTTDRGKTSQKSGNSTINEANHDDRPSSAAAAQLAENTDILGDLGTRAPVANEGDETHGGSRYTLFNGLYDDDRPASPQAKDVPVKLTENSDRLGEPATRVVVADEGGASRENTGNIFLNATNDDDRPSPPLSRSSQPISPRTADDRRVDAKLHGERKRGKRYGLEDGFKGSAGADEEEEHSSTPVIHHTGTPTDTFEDPRLRSAREVPGHPPFVSEDPAVEGSVIKPTTLDEDGSTSRVPHALHTIPGDYETPRRPKSAKPSGSDGDGKDEVVDRALFQGEGFVSPDLEYYTKEGGNEDAATASNVPARSDTHMAKSAAKETADTIHRQEEVTQASGQTLRRYSEESSATEAAMAGIIKV